MNFLQPVFLMLAAAAAVPLLIHIFNRRRVREIPFGSLLFIRRSERRSMRSINLRRLLVLFLRMAAIALVAAAFARPVIRGSLAAMFPGGGSRAVCILLDGSYSMGTREGERSLFDRARGRVEDIAGNLGDEDEVSLMVFDTECATVYEGSRFTPDTAERLLGARTPSFRPTDTGGAVEKAEEWLEGKRNSVKELYIVSDFQRSSGWRKGKGGHATRAFLLPVQPKPGENASIERVLTPRVPLHRGETAPVKIFITNNSDDVGARFPVRVLLDGRTVLEREVDMGPGGSAAMSLDLPVEKSGWLEGEVVKKEDRLAADDRRFFCINSREKAKVLLVGDDSSFFLAQALSPEGADGDIDLRIKGWGGYVSSDIDWADAIVLGPGRPAGAGDEEIIRRYAEKGGRVLVLVSRDNAALARQLSAYSPVIDFPPDKGSFETVEIPEAKPDLLSPFDPEDIVNLSRIPFRSAPRIGGVPDGRVLLRFRSGYPFMWRESRGSGTVLFAALDPSGGSREMVLSPLFLPLVQQAVLAMDPAGETGEGLEIGGTLSLDPQGAGDYTVTMPDGSEYIAPAAYEGGIELKKREGTGTVDLPAGDQPGIIEVRSRGKLVMKAAVNPDCSKESYLGTVTAAAAADSLGLARAAVILEGEEVAGGIRSAREGKDISVFLIVLAALMLLAELAVSQRRETAAG